MNERWHQCTGAKHAKFMMEKSDMKRTNRFLSLERRDIRLVTGVLTGHVCLNKHLQTMQIRDDPSCDGCLEMHETASHFLFDCPKYNGIRVENRIDRDWKCRTGEDIDTLRSYIKETGRLE